MYWHGCAMQLNKDDSGCTIPKRTNPAVVKNNIENTLLKIGFSVGSEKRKSNHQFTIENKTRPINPNRVDLEINRFQQINSVV